jgi:hypothetical protein
MTTTLDTVQELADQLSPVEQVQLIAYLTQRLVPTLSAAASYTAPKQSDERWDNLELFWKSLEELGAGAPSATEQLFADRSSRQASVENGGHVHP